MTDEVGTGAAAKNYIRNKRQLGLLMTIGDVNDGWREAERKTERERREWPKTNECSSIIRLE